MGVISSTEDRLLIDELLGFRAQFSDAECDGSPLRIRAEGGESEQTELNLRALLLDAASRISALHSALTASRQETAAALARAETAEAATARARNAALEDAAGIVDRFTCGACGMDGKPGNVIRAARTEEPRNG